MDGYSPMKLKRKELEDVNDDFSDFSLSSPATKIRRLDAELPPIIEDEECEIPIVFELPEEQRFGSNSLRGLRIEELPDAPENEERAIVLFKPTNTTPLVKSPSNFSVSVNPHLISGLKNQLQWSSQSNSWRLHNDESAEENSSGSSDGCLAVVPWVPSQLHPAPATKFSSQIDNSEMMDVQEMEEATMDIDEGSGFEQNDNFNEGGGMSLNEGFHQWQQQQHCMIPQPPHNTTTPIVWYR